jgi:cyanophycinase
MPVSAQRSSGPRAGTLILDGGGGTKPVIKRFVEAAGGDRARIVVMATGPSAIRFGLWNTVLNPDWPRVRPEWRQYEAYLKGWLGIDAVEVLHTRDRAVADSERFGVPLDSATGVFLVSGNAGRYTDAYLGTRTQAKLEHVLARGGVIAGSSAGAIALGSFVVRGDPTKPLLMAPGRTTGFGFLTNVAVNPHVTSAQRDAELLNVIDAHPGVLGLGIEDDAAVVVRGNTLEVIGTGRVAIYDDVEREGAWYYWLSSGEMFDLAKWTRVGGQRPRPHQTPNPLPVVVVVTILAATFLTVWPAWRTARRAGFAGLTLLAMCMPVVNWLVLAFREWPIERRQRGPGHEPSASDLPTPVRRI